MAKNESVREQMFASIVSWQQSDLSQKEWCRQQDIAYHIFHYWYRVYREEHQQPGKGDSFVRLSVKPEANASCEVVFADGTVSTPFCKQFLVRVFHFSWPFRSIRLALGYQGTYEVFSGYIPAPIQRSVA
jgi:hypothetical protein